MSVTISVFRFRAVRIAYVEILYGTEKLVYGIYPYISLHGFKIGRVVFYHFFPIQEKGFEYTDSRPRWGLDTVYLFIVIECFVDG